MTASISLWAHAIAALLFVLVGAWQIDRHRDRLVALMIAACAATAAWAALGAIDGGATLAVHLLETARNAAWIGFLFFLLKRGGHRQGGATALHFALMFVLCATVALDIGAETVKAGPSIAHTIVLTAFTLRMIFAIGAMVAVHNLFVAAAPGARAGIRLPMTALAIMWGVDLNLYVLSWLQQSFSPELGTIRAIAMIGLAPVFALGARRNTDWTIRLSRSVAFRSVSLVVALGYLTLIVGIGTAVQTFAGSQARALQTMMMLAAALVVAGVVASPRARAWATVMMAKHLFEHRYDYRSEWLRFTETLGAPGSASAPLDVRLVKAIADITQSPGGVLLVPDADGLIARSNWLWAALTLPRDVSCASLIPILAKGRIIELDPLRRESGDSSEARAMPEWMMAEGSTWAIVPLVHFDRLVGAVLLERPLIDRMLDWEDFDLLRLAGRQGASYLAEARVQEALSDAERFDEFNRRFAFIMHDIKNLVSQLTLVTKNAEKHADNPAFREDMVATLKSSTAKMNDLLERLSQHNKVRAEEPRPVALGAIVAGAAAQRRTQHPIVVAGDMTLFALADQARLEQALGHIVQNAIDASPAAEPVTITLHAGVDGAGIEVADKGMGMSPDFIRNSLFRPFASTKSGGFGIGAYEARSLIVAMGGRITVMSTEDEGSVFSIWLPAAQGFSNRQVA